MPEMILPGTYIEVRAEKLIAPGPISIGNVGIVGTARKGRLGDATDPTSVYTPSNIGDARQIFGDPDPFESPNGDVPLTLVRALELAYANGAQRVFAVRVAGPGAVEATFTVGGMTFTAAGPGVVYNDYGIKIEDSGNNRLKVTMGKVFVPDAAVPADKDVTAMEVWRDVPDDAVEFYQVFTGKHATYPYSSKASSGGISTLFAAPANAPAAGTIAATPAGQPVQATGGADGSNDASATAYTEGLNALLNQDVHIVVVAGQNASDLGAALKAHVETASSDGMRHERIGVIGSDATSISQIIADSAGQDDGRIVFVAPGLVINDSATEDGTAVTLPGSYTAAAVAGLISSLDPHISPTNKTINALKLATAFNGTELEQLVMSQVFTLENKLRSIRVTRGVTSSANTAWLQVTTRRIVDYARIGVRAAANPFIGKLNNDRVRQALKGSINSLMADMVDREMLVSYKLDVSATRAQEIRGIAQVTMVVRPTFSIDYIRVVMYLE